MTIVTKNFWHNFRVMFIRFVGGFAVSSFEIHDEHYHLCLVFFQMFAKLSAPEPFYEHHFNMITYFRWDVKLVIFPNSVSEQQLFSIAIYLPSLFVSLSILINNRLDFVDILGGWRWIKTLEMLISWNNEILWIYNKYVNSWVCWEFWIDKFSLIRFIYIGIFTEWKICQLTFCTYPVYKCL